MQYIKFIVPIFLLLNSCADSSSTSAALSGGSSSAKNPQYTDISDNDFAEIPTAVSGSFRRLKCDFDYPKTAQTSADILCNSEDEAGNMSDFESLENPQIFINAPEELRYDVYYCDDFSECHWRVNIQNQSSNPNLGALMSKVQVGLNATTADGELIKMKTYSEPVVSQNYAQENDCANGICLGDFNQSCVTTCQLRSLSHDDQRAASQNNMASCMQMRSPPYYPDELDAKIYDLNGNDVSITSVSNPFSLPTTSYMNEIIRNSPSGCYLIYDNKPLLNFRWYYYAHSEQYNPEAYHPQIKRFCYCR